MPILTVEPDRYPAEVLTADDRMPGRKWCVAHVKSRQEKSLARWLNATHLPYFAPVAAKRALIRGRPTVAYIPLFPGYVFVRCLPDDLPRIRRTQRVADVLPVYDQDRLKQELLQVDRVLKSGLPVFPEDRIEPGNLVTVQAGPLLGLQGYVVRRASGGRFVVRVDFIRQGVAVELEEGFLARLSVENVR